MDESSSVAKRTRAKTWDIDKRLAEYNGKKSMDSSVMNAEDKNGEDIKGEEEDLRMRPTPPEKEGWEIEIDNLFAEMEMCILYLLLTLLDQQWISEIMDV
ncbi:hypothetical protein ACH5RR_037289 [Cinchona calisaya]|uniref:Uncharacterized protein n=1 Tax=Cinchona calisaya TaxID=153742 RepID=A0ABD2YAI5_9GENT